MRKEEEIKIVGKVSYSVVISTTLFHFGHAFFTFYILINQLICNKNVLLCTLQKILNTYITTTSYSIPLNITIETDRYL